MTRQIEHNKRDFSTHLFQTFVEFHMVILRLRAENPVVRTDGTALFLASFLKNRLLDIDLELRNLSKKIKADEDKARQKEQALTTFARMKTELADLRSRLVLDHDADRKEHALRAQPPSGQWKWR